MHSAIYRGWLEHRRHQPRRHAFRYPLFMVYLDLAELEQVFAGRWFWSTTRRALARFDRRDHLGEPALPLDEAVRRLVAERTGTKPTGPVRLLTHLRYFGHCFNPVSFYYCFDESGERIETIVAEVNNTPWGEQHCYVLPMPGGDRPQLQAHSAKAMHVSPFHAMELDYEWRFAAPGRQLAVHMALRPAGAAAAAATLFDATLTMQRQPITGGSLAAILARFPLMTVRVLAAIHWQALKLWVKRVPVHAHPSIRTESAA